jgi:polysaccharide pyruvyl transferase WcaK-like protein
MGISTRKILLLGYSGKANFGDDLLLKQAVDALAVQKDFSLTIHTSETSASSDYLNRWFPEAEIVKGAIQFSLIRRHTHVIYFGGGVFFEYNKLGLLLFLRRLFSMLLLFSIPRYLLGVKFAGIGMGLGPFYSRSGSWLTAFRLKHFSYLVLRDQDSLNLARQMGIQHLSICPDLSMLECGSIPENSEADSGRRSGVLICARHYPHGLKGNRYLQALKVALARFRTTYSHVPVSIFGFQKNHDEDAVALLAGEGINAEIWDPFRMRPADVPLLFSGKELIISSRMHGIFMAGIAGAPSLAIGVHPKLRYASGFFENSRSISEDAEAEEIYQAMVELMGRRATGISQELSSAAESCAAVYQGLVKFIRKGKGE